jgi:hypothetical protein
MANTIYDAARYKLMNGLFNWPLTNLVLTCWSGTPTFVPGDTTIQDILNHGLTDRGSSLPITSKTVAPDGTAQTNQVVIPAVPIGAPLTFFTMSERNVANYLFSDLILFIDEALDLPFDPNGLDIIVQPDWLQRRGWWKA